MNLIKSLWRSRSAKRGVAKEKRAGVAGDEERRQPRPERGQLARLRWERGRPVRIGESRYRRSSVPVRRAELAEQEALRRAPGVLDAGVAADAQLPARHDVGRQGPELFPEIDEVAVVARARAEQIRTALRGAVVPTKTSRNHNGARIWSRGRRERVAKIGDLLPHRGRERIEAPSRRRLQAQTPRRGHCQNGPRPWRAGG